MSKHKLTSLKTHPVDTEAGKAYETAYTCACTDGDSCRAGTAERSQQFARKAHTRHADVAKTGNAVRL